MLKKLDKISLSTNKRAIFSILAAIFLLPVAILAQGTFRSFVIESENGSLLGNVMVESNANASGGRYVTYGMNPTSAGCTAGPLISMGICLDPNTTPRPVAGVGEPRLVNANYAPNYSDGVGAFRTECFLSHTSKNDPIVYPGQKDAAHWHQFFGNTAADENLTNPAVQGNSTCNGGTLNRTAYWAPALIDTNSYDPVTQTFDTALPMTWNDSLNPGAPAAGGTAMQVYYKSAYNGVLSANVEWFPPGLRMIAGGNPNVAPTGPPVAQLGSNPNFSTTVIDCISWGHAQSFWGTRGVDHDIDTIPVNCPPGYYIQASVIFPQCGAEDAQGNPILDSPNHRSHMSYPLGWPDRGCPASHPREYPEILEHFRWRVPATGAAGLRFSSDMYSGSAAGLTFHADWWNGWDPATSQSIIDNCFHGRSSSGQVGLDCSMNLVRPNSSGGWLRLGDPASQ